MVEKQTMESDWAFTKKPKLNKWRTWIWNRIWVRWAYFHVFVRCFLCFPPTCSRPYHRSWALCSVLCSEIFIIQDKQTTNTWKQLNQYSLIQLYFPRAFAVCNRKFLLDKHFSLIKSWTDSKFYRPCGRHRHIFNPVLISNPAIIKKHQNN